MSNPSKPAGFDGLKGFAYQFRAGDSPIHRLGAGWKLLIGSLMSMGAFAARDPWTLGLLLAVNFIYYRLAHLKLSELWRDIRFFLIQIFVVMGLYIIRYGLEDGFQPGLRTGLQVLLFFMPGAVFLRTTQASQMIRSLRRIMPPRISFLLFTSFRFVPFFAREMHEIYIAQKLRGARLSPRQLLVPHNWIDVFHCLMIPLIVRAIKIADEAALSAEARGFGINTLSDKGKTHFD
ncbi:MAG: energy-coupling factor transporter transmembrane protein EcfT [Desulfobacterales bacterium]|nr:energy-coupling factor transporter transmembrane protein EcfT [Desulfobacterales bacterium]